MLESEGDGTARKATACSLHMMAGAPIDSVQTQTATADQQLLASWIEEQLRTAAQVVANDDVDWKLGGLRLVGGLDISFEPAAAGQERAVAALCVLSFPELQVVHEDYAPVDMTVPYIPGFLGFREVPAYAQLLQRLHNTPLQPQVVLVDGCGTLHPRGCGSASQLGVLTGYATVGVAKNLLAVDGLERFDVRAAFAALASRDATDDGQVIQGSVAGARDEGDGTGSVRVASTGGRGMGQQQRAEEGAQGQAQSSSCDWRGSLQSGEPAGTSQQQQRQRHAGAAATAVSRDRQVPLRGDSGKLHGMAVCSGHTNKPIFISVGHRLSLDTCVEIVRRCCRHKIPEPIRQADLRSRQWLRDHAPPTQPPAE